MCCAARNADVLVVLSFLVAAPRAGVTCAARSIVAGTWFLFWILRRAQSLSMRVDFC
ncbi:hypothetical protein A2U01_0059686 [Trifolium medium]|uniref:Uncharacterized protein n=1 Tax=Trifolium medium TaxID=97028 RepID=A0A392RP74_9FABA|nr:hypothetical protein [Trifolium medium]